MKKHLFILLLTGFLFSGCQDGKDQMTAKITLEGNPTTGYTWVYAMSPEGIVREVSSEYIPDKTKDNVAGSGGKFVFVFEAISPGETEITFSYLRTWETGIPAIKTVIYRALVDDRNNLTLKKK